MTEVPDAVAFQAQNPSAVGPAPHPDTKAERVMTEEYCLLITSMPTVSFVERLHLNADQVADTVREVRDLLRARGRTQAAWCVDREGDAAVEAELRALGLTDYDDPPLEPSFASMALTRPPDGTVTADVEVRRCMELDDYRAAGRLMVEVTGITGEDRDAMLASMERRQAMEADGRVPMGTYLALLDGQVVGEAQASLLDAGSNLSGGSVLAAARGRGVYRALVRARWDDAVARDRPALTVQAGSMSQPILERLGFVTVGTRSVLRDRFQ